MMARELLLNCVATGQPLHVEAVPCSVRRIEKRRATMWVARYFLLRRLQWKESAMAVALAVASAAVWYFLMGRV